MNVDDEIQLPPWATGVAVAFMQVGAQLCTKDGRKIGNAVMASFSWRHLPNGTSECEATVITDFGNRMVMTSTELEELFHFPKWVMNVADHPGVQRHLSQLSKGEHVDAR